MPLTPSIYLGITEKWELQHETEIGRGTKTLFFVMFAPNRKKNGFVYTWY